MDEGCLAPSWTFQSSMCGSCGPLTSERFAVGVMEGQVWCERQELNTVF